MLTEVCVTEIDFRKDPRWETFVASHPDGLIYHHPGWLQAMENEYGQKCVSLACEDTNGKLQGILALFYTRGMPFNVGTHRTRRRLSSLPRTPVAGPLTIDVRATAALIHAAIERIQQEPGVELEIKTQVPGLDQLVEGLVCWPWRMTYVQELPDLPEKIRFGNSRNHARIRWSVNKATKLGVHLRSAETESDLRNWYQLYLRTMCANVVPPRPYRFFAALWEELEPRGLIQLVLAEQHANGRSRLLAGSVFLLFGGTVFYAFNGSCQEDLWLRPNDLIQWHAIHDACRRDFRRYDFGEVPEWHPQLADFKSKWGARPMRLYRYYYPAPMRLSTDRPRLGGLWYLANTVWRRLPLKVTTWLGERIYSYL